MGGSYIKRYKRIIEFIIHNYDPKLSLTAKIENIELACHVPFFAIYRGILGLIFYIAIRGWLFPRATIQRTSLFGFVAISALVGLFSVQAVLKLQDVAETGLQRQVKGGSQNRR